jgi:predicted DNA-binding transcriptional regulator AlpA
VVLDESGLFSVPRLDDIANDPACVIGAPAEVLAALATKLVAAHHAVASEQARRLIARDDTAPGLNREEGQDRLLTAEEAAPLLGLTVEQLKRRASEYRFTKKLGHRTVRFSEIGLRHWIERRPPALRA